MAQPTAHADGSNITRQQVNRIRSWLRNPALAMSSTCPDAATTRPLLADFTNDDA
jgi:hypothetical protein